MPQCLILNTLEKDQILDFEGWEYVRCLLAAFLGPLYLSFLVMLNRSVLGGKGSVPF